MSRDTKYHPHWLIYIDVVQLVGCQTPLHGQAVDKSGSGNLARSEPNILTCQDVGLWRFFVRRWQICNGQVVDKL